MAKLRLYPHSGTVEDAKSLKFEIQGLDDKLFHVSMEDATHGNRIAVSSLQDMGDGTFMGHMNINIPKNSTQSAISIFAHIEEKQDDGSVNTIQICPSVFSIDNEMEKCDKELSITPTYIGPEDICKVTIRAAPNAKFSISVGQSVFRVISNADGLAQIHFKGGDVLKGSDADSVQKLPVYLYTEEDNFTQKKFSGEYLNILPYDLALHATLDPRCDAFVSGTWEMPSECLEDPESPIVEPPDGPVIPPVGIPTSCMDIEDSQDACKIFSSSVTLLNNGMVLYAYSSPDSAYTDTSDGRFNINRVFINSNNTSVDVQIVATEDIVIEPKEVNENFRLHVSDTLWNILDFTNPSVEDIYVVFFSKATGFQRVRIIEKLTEEEVANPSLKIEPVKIVIGDVGNTNVKINGWLFCVNSVFYHDEDKPSLYIGSNALPYIQDADNNYLPVINVSIACNSKYIGPNEESYVYIVAEAMASGNSQLFFYSLSLAKNDSIATQNYGWKQLTETGNNRSPKIKADAANNLHVVWESDRGNIDQLYYGVLGVSYKSIAVSALSSSLDKYSDAVSYGVKSFDYLKVNLMDSGVIDEYNPVPIWDTQSLLSDEEWVINTGDGGQVSKSGDNYLKDITVSANPMRQEALAFKSLQIVFDNVEVDPSVEDFPYQQYNYQVAFDMAATIEQNTNLISDTTYDGVTVGAKEIDNLISSWTDSNFDIFVDKRIKNQPVYTQNNNKFVIGRRDNVFDRIVPIIGAYKNANPSDLDFQIKILKNNNNLKDFTIGLMFEKTYVSVTNIDSINGYIDKGYKRSEYIPTWTEKVYTGRAKFAVFIKTEEVSDTRADYVIVREFPEVLDVSELTNYAIIMNYTAVSSGDVANMLGTTGQTYLDKFVGTITMMINSIPRFSQSFISTLNDDYNYFDIGFGVPSGGYYISDKMTPSKLGVFDNVSSIIQFSSISITSPSYEYNSDIVSVPTSIRDILELKVEEEVSVPVPSEAISYSPTDAEENSLLTLNFRDKNVTLYSLYADDTTGENYETSIEVDGIDIMSVEFNTGSNGDRMTIFTSDELLYDTGFVTTIVSLPLKFDINVSLLNSVGIIVEAGSPSSSWNFNIYFKKSYGNNSFLQVPITVEGANQSVDIDVGICNDIHLAWQSNRNRYWNIFYANSVNKLSPFRFETAITDTSSNSLKPSMSVARNGARAISWHDNRKGNYNVYMARSLEGYSCDEDACEKKMLKKHKDQIVECSISLDFDVATTGIHNFSIEFYSDSGLSDLHKTISMEDAVNRWFTDGTVVTNSVIYEDDILLGINLISGNSVTISYLLDRNDDIFDMVLYTKLVYSLT